MRDGVSRQNRTEPERVKSPSRGFSMGFEHGQPGRKITHAPVIGGASATPQWSSKLLLILWLWQGETLRGYRDISDGVAKQVRDESK